MTNSDYLIRAAIKKLSEKLNQTFLEKFEEAASVAQEMPVFLKKELEVLIDEVFQEAKKMEKDDSNSSSSENETNQINTISECDQEIKEINLRLEILNRQFKN
tara:strand:+ start:440 stop:748 length:309 start_codon:yes stop_codon:yes gene_type:complete